MNPVVAANFQCSLSWVAVHSERLAFSNFEIACDVVIENKPQSKSNDTAFSGCRCALVPPRLSVHIVPSLKASLESSLRQQHSYCRLPERQKTALLEDHKLLARKAFCSMS